ncbi:MAG: hypothetical protein C0467_11960 [Planctomycetaceae bacterium]|nr:hypothetical protein [Planctomycetaceae bacterium]
MNEIAATELQILGCFGVEPRLRDSEVPWCYNDAAYLTEIDGLWVSFAIAPAYHDVRILVARGNQRLFEFNSMGVMDVRVIDEPGVDAVEVVLSKQAWLKLQLRPLFEITQGFAVDTAIHCSERRS